jgi:hypothetical protein
VSLVFRIEDYPRYRERVGGATYVDCTRRTDPARVQRPWLNLSAIHAGFGPPWVVQIWTKDAAGVLARGGALLERLRDEGTTLTVQITATGLGGSVWEPRAPAEPFRGLAELASIAGGPRHVTWRYDPVIPTVHRRERFRRLADRAAELGIARGVLNFLVPPGRYKRVDTRLAEALLGWGDGMPGYDEAWRSAVAAELVADAAERGLTLHACAESAALAEAVEGLQPAACGDHAWFVALSGRDPGRAASRGSRPACGCAVYCDVGLYGQWRRCHGCLYCYAG